MSFGIGIGLDLYEYNGWDAVGAIGFDIFGFAIGAMAGAAFASAFVPVAAIGLSIGVATGIGFAVSSAKDALLKKENE